jgi:hypothetical protein
MTDSRVSRGALQVLVLPVPSARVSAGAEQALVTTTPSARVSRGALQAMVPDRPQVQIARVVVQVLTSVSAAPLNRPLLRTVGSSRPVQMKQADGSWWAVQLRA